MFSLVDDTLIWSLDSCSSILYCGTTYAVLTSLVEIQQLTTSLKYVLYLDGLLRKLGRTHL